VAVQKVTAHVDRDLLQVAQERTGQGGIATIRQGLEFVAASEVDDHLRALRGKVTLLDQPEGTPRRSWVITVDTGSRIAIYRVGAEPTSMQLPLPRSTAR
jgi:hypothetical protein